MVVPAETESLSGADFMPKATSGNSSSQPHARIERCPSAVRNATEMPPARGLALERNLFLRLCISEPALARMRSYEGANITSPSPSIEIEAGSVNHD